jgi:agmatine deiminase
MSTTTAEAATRTVDAMNQGMMPPEWTPHYACLILYPHVETTFRLECRPAQAEIHQIAKAIVHDGDEDVVFFCLEKQYPDLVEQYKDEPRIHIEICNSNDTWARDTGPTFILTNNQKSLVALDWDFNGYGGPELGTYWPCDLDKMIPSTMCTALSHKYNVPIQLHPIDIVLEGGSIHVDGQGTCMTTSECLLHPNRNPTKSKDEIEKTVLAALGCSKMLWLPFGVAHDEDTNGHIDNMACFTSPTNVLLNWTDLADDPENYQRCRQAMDYLMEETDAKGRSLTVHKLYLPPPLYYTADDVNTLSTSGTAVHRVAGERLAASYVNFYIANKAVIVPQFGVEPFDGDALETLKTLFPSRKVMGVASREILLGGGNIHCQTQQMPRLE